eukprot:XP_001699954.1 predicted protein [Chlamydomonas reinhardtii]
MALKIATNSVRPCTAAAPSRVAGAVHSTRAACPLPGAAHAWRHTRAPPAARPLLVMAPLRAAAVEAPAAPLTTPAAAQLYLLHCHLPAAASQATALAKLHGDLRTMEKVSKDAAWFASVEASDGEHVLMVTDNAKHAKKYGLQALPRDVATYSVELGGAGDEARRVEVPLAELAAALAAEMSSDSDSDEEEEGMAMGGAAVAVAAGMPAVPVQA